jgi:hypothetical protein
MKKNTNWYAIFYLIKFFFFAMLASYGYSISSKWTLGWFSIAMLELALFIVEELKPNTNEN